jgi:hypothetical protein
MPVKACRQRITPNPAPFTTSMAECWMVKDASNGYLALANAEGANVAERLNGGR